MPLPARKIIQHTMGASASVELSSAEEALAAGKTQEEIDAFLAASSRSTAGAFTNNFNFNGGTVEHTSMIGTRVPDVTLHSGFPDPLFNVPRELVRRAVCLCGVCAWQICDAHRWPRLSFRAGTRAASLFKCAGQTRSCAR
jgi:hypothetical protein